MYWTKEKRNWGAIKMWSWAEPLAHYWQPACAWKWNKNFFVSFIPFLYKIIGGLDYLHDITISFIALQFLSIHKWCHTLLIWTTLLTIIGGWAKKLCIIPVVKILLGCTKGAVVRFGRAGGLREWCSTPWWTARCKCGKFWSAIIAQ